MQTLNNDIDDYVTMGIGEGKLVEVSKTNLKSISTEDNPCIEEEDKLIRTDCQLREVYISCLAPI